VFRKPVLEILTPCHVDVPAFPGFAGAFHGISQ